MTTYNVQINREVRLVFESIEAESLEEAAAIAGEKHPAAADDIDSCDGEMFSAQVDVAGNGEHEQPRIIDFDPERQRHAAPKLLEQLIGISNAWSAADGSSEVMDYLERRLYAIRAAISEAEGAGITPAPDATDVHAILARYRLIGLLWGIEDVRDVRPDLSDDQCWEVLQHVERRKDAEIGINWSVLEFAAEDLFGDAPEADDVEEEQP